jgi:hypothetical protein
MTDYFQELGVFVALEHAYLDTLQIIVTTGSGVSRGIRETYTYCFTYHGMSVASIELKEHQQFLSLSEAQHSFKAAVRCLLRALRDLPRLPGNKLSFMPLHS